jgi:carbon monoxide dehydrogenase subunit G
MLLYSFLLLASTIIKDLQMDIEGNYTLQASPEEVWSSLMDQQVLLRTVPGIEHIERLADDTYAVVLHILHAPFKGTYHGHVATSKQDYPHLYHLAIDSEGSQNNFSGDVVIRLNRHKDTTVISYKGALEVGPQDTRSPQSVVKGAAKLLIQQFFIALANQLHDSVHPRRDVAEEEIIIVQEQPATSDAEPLVGQTPFTKVILTIMRAFKVGAGDKVQEALWLSRMRLLGLLAGLLFLVWVGTRLPRRP